MNKHTPEIVTVALDIANRQYSVTLPVDTHSYTIKTRGNSEFKVAYKNGVLGATGTQDDYLSIPSGSCEAEENINRQEPITIYVECEKAGEVLEVKRWR